MANGFEVQRLREVYRHYSLRDLPNTRWSPDNAGNLAILKEREDAVGNLLADTGFLPLSNKRLLDVGCGVGAVLASFERWGASPENLFGVDLLSDRIQAARERFPGLAFEEANAEALLLRTMLSISSFSSPSSPRFSTPSCA